MDFIKGKKYVFTVESKNYNFAIKAQCKSTKRYSYINNLNIILSEFGVDIDDPRTAESTWEVREYEANRLANIAKQFLRDTPFLNYTEKQLDLDRKLGEWENISK